MALEGRPMIGGRAFTRDRNSRPHTASEIRARTRGDSRTTPVRTDTGQNRHSHRECVCPVRFVRSHGLAGHHRTLSALSPLSALSDEGESCTHLCSTLLRGNKGACGRDALSEPDIKTAHLLTASAWFDSCLLAESKLRQRIVSVLAKAGVGRRDNQRGTKQNLKSPP